jgi:Fe-S-cluster containining protein
LVPVRSYFTFPDGVLGYDCARCGQRCCRGRGIALTADELIPLVRRAPSLASQVRLRAGGSVHATDLTDGCWFLARDGRCAVEVDAGRASKPATCRLFPFNRVYRVGDVRIVDFNATLCPIERVDDGARHDDLAAEIDAEAARGSPLVDVPLPAPVDLPPSWADDEERIARRLFALSEVAAAGEDPFVALGRALGLDDESTRAARGRAIGWARLGAVGDEALVAHARSALPSVALALPSWRIGRLFTRPPQRWADAVHALAPRAHALLAIAAAATATAGAPPSIRGVTELAAEGAQALEVIARWDDAVAAPTTFAVDVPPALEPALGAVLGAAFRLAPNGARRTLGELAAVAQGALPDDARPLALALIGALLPTFFPV